MSPRPSTGTSSSPPSRAAFAGVVSDYLYQASELLGTSGAQQWAARAAGEYERLGASWWLRRLPPAAPGHRANAVRAGGRPEEAYPAVARPGAAQPGVMHLRAGGAASGGWAGRGRSPPSVM